MSRLTTPVTGQLPRFIDDEDQEQTRKNLAAGLDLAQTGREGADPVQTAARIAASRIAGNAQVVLNPFVESNRDKISAIKGQRDAIDKLLGQTTDQTSRQELLRARSITDQRVRGETTTFDDAYSDFDPQMEAVARWASRNNRSQRAREAAMRQLRTNMAARTGLSQAFQRRVQESQVQAQQLEQFKQANPEMASFALTDPETGQPTINRDAYDLKLKQQKLQQDEREAAEERRLRLQEAREKVLEQKLDRLYKGMGLDQKQGEGESASPPWMQARKLKEYEAAANAVARQEMQEFMTPEELDARYPAVDLTAGAKSAMSAAGLDVVRDVAKQQVSFEPVPQGLDARSFARQRGAKFVANADIAIKQAKNGLLNPGDLIVIPGKGLTTVPEF